MLSLVLAINNNRTIGLNGKMPWNNKEDLQFFRKTTMGKTIVMGRKTIDGLPKSLDGRNILTVSRDKSLPNVILDFDQFLQQHQSSSEDIYICGGGEIYAKAMPFASRIILSIINDDTVGDTFFAEIGPEFVLEKEEQHDTFKVEVYKRK